MFRRHLTNAAIAALLLAACGGSKSQTTPQGANGGGGDGVVGGPRPGDPTPPKLKLPTDFKPVKNRVHVAIDPAKPGFKGTIAIDGEVTKATSLLWLNSEDLKLARANAHSGGQDVALEPIVYPGYVALRAPRELAPGPLTIEVDFEGT